MLQNFKVIFLGDSGVGKTSLIVRGTHGIFEHQNSTIGFSFQRLKKNNVDLMLWDTAGQEMYRSMVKMYYRGIHAAVIVYDISNKESFLSVQNWIKDVEEK